MQMELPSLAPHLLLCGRFLTGRGPGGWGLLLYHIRYILLFPPLILRNPSGGLSTPPSPSGKQRCRED